MTIEIPMKQWRIEEAIRLHLHDTSVAKRLANGYYKRLKVRRVNARVVFVQVAARISDDAPGGAE